MGNYGMVCMRIRILVDSGSTLTLSGTGFGTDRSKTNVNIGSSYQCAVTSQSDTSIQCSYDLIPAGTYTVLLTTEYGETVHSISIEYGNANF